MTRRAKSSSKSDNFCKAALVERLLPIKCILFPFGFKALIAASAPKKDPPIPATTRVFPALSISFAIPFALWASPLKKLKSVHK